MNKLYALHDPDLTPKVQYLPERPDVGMVLNIDAAIQLARDGISPKAKAIYRMYLKHRRILQKAGMSGREMRTEAFYRALEESGAKIVNTQLGEG